MMRQGRSFSGHERNCFFLNTASAGGPNARFANISAATGLNFPDDGRAVAIVDWDDDGDLDVWISNRNAPRVRWMRNDTPNENHFLLLKLVGNGTGTNRDAIGARVEVVAGERPKSIRTLRAGEGFLAQSSKWLHFGLGQADRVEKVVVHWPTQDPSSPRIEEFSDLAVDGRYRLVQGQSEAREVAIRNNLTPLKPSTPVIRSPSRSARVPVVTLLPVPEMLFGTRQTPVTTGKGKPILISLWASYCAHCVRELAEFRDRAEEIRAAGLEVVALSVDNLEESSSDPAAAQRVIQKLAFPFTTGSASEDFLRLAQWYHDALIGTDRQLPLPASFLVDGQGRLSVIYKGPVSVDDLLADLSHSTGSRHERWLRAALVTGRSIEHQKIMDTASNYEATVHLRQATMMARQGMFEFGIYHLHQAIRLRPDFVMAYLNLAEIYLRTGRLSEARTYLEKSIEVSPESVPAYFELAQLDADEGYGEKAIELYRTGLRMEPNDLEARNNLAWLLATNADDGCRDGGEALRLALEIVDETGGENPTFLATLAAAHAEVGRYVEAAKTARVAISIADAATQSDMVTRIRDQLRAYEREQPIREQRVR